MCLWIVEAGRLEWLPSTLAARPVGASRVVFRL